MRDARRAGEALLEAGARQVWLFGSLARGEERACSDIDLVAVFDDLEYRNRWRIETEMRKTASAAAGRPVDVVVTDRPEWRIQTRQVSASFAAAIGQDLTLLAHRPPLMEVDWDKEQTMAISNEELAAQRINDMVGQLAKVLGGLDPSPREGRATDHGERQWLASARMIGLCEAAHLIVEGSLKAVGALTGVQAKTLYDHNVEKIARALPTEERDAMLTLIRSAPELVKTPGYISMWRTRGAYGMPTEGMTAQEIATAGFTAAMLSIAVEVATAAVERGARHGVEPSNLPQFRTAIDQIRDHVANIDVGTGEPLNNPHSPARKA